MAAACQSSPNAPPRPAAARDPRHLGCAAAHPPAHRHPQTHALPPLKSDVSENKLASVPPAIGRCSSLTRLDLHSNSIVTVPKELGRLGRVKHLSLHFNAIEELPVGGGGEGLGGGVDARGRTRRRTGGGAGGGGWGLGRCGVLKLARPRVGFTSDCNAPAARPRTRLAEIGGCTSLLWLSLHANPMASCPKELGLLTNMTRLSLHMLEVGAHAFVRRGGAAAGREPLPGPRGLVGEPRCALLVAGRILRVHPRLLSSRPNRAPTHLHRTPPCPQLESLPPELGAVTRMEAVSLFKNRIAAIPGPVLSGWKLLRRLALYENALTSLPPEIGDMEGLQEL